MPLAAMNGKCRVSSLTAACWPRPAQPVPPTVRGATCSTFRTPRPLPLQVLYEARDWKGLGEYVVLLSKRRGQLKQAVQAMVRQCMGYLPATPDQVRWEATGQPPRQRCLWATIQAAEQMRSSERAVQQTSGQLLRARYKERS